MATHRATFTLDDEAIAFLSLSAGENKSAYINELLKQEKKRVLAMKIAQDNQEEAEDIDYQNELSVWDSTIADGLK